MDFGCLRKTASKCQIAANTSPVWTCFEASRQTRFCFTWIPCAFSADQANVHSILSCQLMRISTFIMWRLCSNIFHEVQQNPVARDYLILTMTLILTLTTCWHIWEWRITNPGFCSDPTIKSDMGDRSFLCCSHKKAEIIQFHVLWTDQSTIYWMYLAISYRLNTANSPPSAVSSSHLWVVCLFVCLPGSVSWQVNVETGMG